MTPATINGSGLLATVRQHHPRCSVLTLPFASFYSSAEILNHIDGLKNADGTSRGYVADLKFNRKTVFKGVEQQVVEFAKTIPPKDRKAEENFLTDWMG